MPSSRFNPAAFIKFEKDFNRAIKVSLDQGADKVVQNVDNNFRNKSFFGKKWPANTLGTPILVKSGRLRASVRVLDSKQSSRLIGTRLEYASTHNDGKTFRNTEAQIGFFWAMYNKTKNPLWKNCAIKLERGGRIVIPKRQFIGKHSKNDRDIKNITIKNLKKI